jgi:hypothetical protein
MDEFSRSLAGLVGNVAFITLLARWRPGLDGKYGPPGCVKPVRQFMILFCLPSSYKVDLYYKKNICAYPWIGLSY